jgi:hypothetical protein
MSSECPPASAGIVNLYTLAANRMRIIANTGTVCETTAVTDFDPFNRTARVVAQCQAGVSGNLLYVIVNAADGTPLIVVAFNQRVEANAGDTVTIEIRLTWS